jgi:hypothetical protein
MVVEIKTGFRSKVMYPPTLLHSHSVSWVAEFHIFPKHEGQNMVVLDSVNANLIESVSTITICQCTDGFGTPPYRPRCS